MSGADDRPHLELSVVVPAHNSGTLIDHTVEQLMARLGGTAAEVIIVENGSTDDTFERCRDLATRGGGSGIPITVLRSEKGMGNALRAGILASHGASVLLTADDLPFGFDDLDAIEQMSAAGGPIPAVVIGSKAHPNSVIDRGAVRGTLTGGFSLMCRVILGMRTRDPQGTLMIDGSLARRVAREATEPGFLFTTELVHIVEGLGIHPVEVPVRLSASHRDHPSRISVRDVISMGIGLVRVRARHLARRRKGSIRQAPSSEDLPRSSAPPTDTGSAPAAASAGTAEAGTDSPPRSPSRFSP